MNRIDLSEALIVLDVDETLVDSTRMHWFLYMIFLRLCNVENSDNIPTYQEMLSFGGSDAAFGKYPGYYQVNELALNSKEFNKRLPQIKGAREVLDTIKDSIWGCLTARPESVQFVTTDALCTLGFPLKKKPIVCRPDSVPMRDTTSWKISYLKKIVQDTEKIIIIIDDSVSLYEAIKNLNDSKIRMILHDGPRTPQHAWARSWAEIQQMLNISEDALSIELR